MTILNHALLGDRALVLVNTTGASPAGPREVSKVLALPHAGAVFAGRGDMDLMRTVWSWHHSNHFDVDDLGQTMPEATAWALKVLRLAHRHVPRGRAMFVVVGPSARQRAMVAASVEVDLDTQRIELTTRAGDGAWLAPWNPEEDGQAPADAFETPEGMLRVARHQATRYGARHGASGGFGGRLLVADLRLGGAINLRDLGSLDEV